MSITYHCMELTTSIDFQSLYSLYEKEKKENAELKAEVLKLQVHLQKMLQMIYGLYPKGNDLLYGWVPVRLPDSDETFYARLVFFFHQPPI